MTLLKAQLAVAALGELRADERDAAAKLLTDLARGIDFAGSPEQDPPRPGR